MSIFLWSIILTHKIYVVVPIYSRLCDRLLVLLIISWQTSFFCYMYRIFYHVLNLWYLCMTELWLQDHILVFEDVICHILAPIFLQSMSDVSFQISLYLLKLFHCFGKQRSFHLPVERCTIDRLVGIASADTVISSGA